MRLIQTAIPDVLLIEPTLFGDHRGFFMEVHRTDQFSDITGGQLFVQDNLSRSTKGVLRGLHFQNPKAQGKLVTVLRGSILDIAVDVRIGSPTFGRHVSCELDEQNRRLCWIPRGFAHGFVVRSDIADVFYKCDEFYSPESEIVLQWDDPDLGIDWQYEAPVVSERDRGGRRLAQLEPRLPRYESIDADINHRR